MINLRRIFFPVGQGGFFAEIFCDEKGQISFTTVYDCGSTSKDNPLEDAIDEFKQILIKGRHNQIDLLFISHFHADHVNGLEELTTGLTVLKTIIPLIDEDLIIITRVYNYLRYETDAESIDKLILSFYSTEKELARFGQIVLVKPFENKDESTPLGLEESVLAQLWGYKTYNSISCEDERAQVFVSELKKTPGAFINGELNTTFLLSKTGKAKVRKIYKKAIHNKNDNLYSLVVLAAPIDINTEDSIPTASSCLYMGDFDFSLDVTLWPQLKVHYPKIGMVQIPHHGARGNYSNREGNNVLSQEHGKHCIIAAGKDNRYHHPNFWVIKDLLNADDIVYVVSEDPQTKAEFVFELTQTKRP
jgi:hypothetical protein